MIELPPPEIKHLIKKKMLKQYPIISCKGCCHLTFWLSA